jgi:hypothetical protein
MHDDLPPRLSTWFPCLVPVAHDAVLWESRPAASPCGGACSARWLRHRTRSCRSHCASTTPMWLDQSVDTAVVAKLTRLTDTKRIKVPEWLRRRAQGHSNGLSYSSCSCGIYRLLVGVQPVSLLPIILLCSSYVACSQICRATWSCLHVRIDQHILF